MKIKVGQLENYPNKSNGEEVKGVINEGMKPKEKLVKKTKILSR